MIQKIDYSGIEDIIIHIMCPLNGLLIVIIENQGILNKNCYNINEKRYLLGFTSFQDILKKIMNLKYLVRIFGC
jgi:hypothetical protein